MKRLALIALCCFTAVAFGQETRSTLTGHVSDPSGARIPDTAIRITNTQTGVVTNAKSNSAGDYTVPFLQPGAYRVDASHAGFKNYTHTGLTLQTEQTVTENITLPVGAVSETVTVEGETPLIDTATASTGQTLTADEIEDLPSNGRSPLGFARFEFGAVAKGKHAASQTRPFDNSTADDFSLGGGASASNELLLNGVPNMQDSSRTAGFSPLLDSVDAVHVDQFTANAALGDTSGGTVNITTKSGTNQFHGTASEYYQGSRPLTAKPYFTPSGTKAPSTHFNQFAGNIGGPVRIPHVFDGRDKLFFLYAFEGYIGNSPATTITSVPTQAERSGDFSALLTTTTSGQLYNPFSGVYNPATKVTTRSAIPGNILSNAGLSISPIAQNYLKLIPLPNYNGASTKADGENNFFASDPTTDNYKSHMGRIDINVTHSDRFSFEAHRSTYDKTASNIFRNILTGTASRVVLAGGFVEDVHNFNPTTNLDFRLGLSRSENSSSPNSAGIKPSSFGFPSYIDANSTQLAIPYLTFSDSAAIPSLSAQPGSAAYFDTVQLWASFNKTIGRHNIKIGPDIRENKNSTQSGSAANGAYTFKTANGGPLTQTSSANGQGFGGTFALFELGLPTSGSQAINPRYQYNTWYTAGFAQDDWKVAHNFTISMGFRMESETSIVESHDRVVAGFNSTATNAATVQAEKNYAASPSPLLPASSFQPTGGLFYATPSQRYAYKTPAIYFSPRIGFAYAPDTFHGTLAFRGGFGIYFNPYNDYNAPQAYGYSATTSYLSNSTNQTNQVPVSNLSDPFNSGVNPLQQPYGSSLGVNTNLGSSAIFFSQLQVPYTEKVSLDVQKQFGKAWMLEVSGFSSHSVHLSSSLNVSAIPMLPLLSHKKTLDTALTTTMNTPVPNPFKGLFPAATTPNGIVIPNGTSYNTSSTISTAQILQQYPQYSGVTEQLVPNQNANFNAIMARLAKRMSYGLQFDVNYEYSRQLGAQSTLNQGQQPAYGETSSDFPQHLTLTLIYQLPFGRGRRFANQSRLADAFAGGWQVTSIYQALSGQPLSWGNVIYTGNWHDLNNHPHQAIGPSFNTSVFDRVSADQLNSYSYRTFPQYFGRSDANNNFDFSVLKNFAIGDRFVVQPRVDAFNALNHVQFQPANLSPTSSSFGTNTSQLNTNRQIQGGVHILF
ncbi:MAG TPA: carboxypeptidase-like regulatory domain-containing protein [Acidobacteriaceae bacterium]|nr:carboxypeptidase-like regulatory domain-containing protein [Acidobacteriaceae bacterium]